VPIDDLLTAALGAPPRATQPLSGGQGLVLRVVEQSGRVVVAKVDATPGADGRPIDLLAREAGMLRFLAARTTLPVPAVLAVTPHVLVLAHVEGSIGVGGAEVHAAELLAALHDTAPDDGAYGFPLPTAIGGLPQDGAPSSSWVAFLRDRRLLPMAAAARAAGRLPAAVHARVERCAARLGELVDEPPRPSLVHGDVWSGNVIVRGARVAAFLDPALGFADGEQDLAFVALFATAGDAFFAAYAARRPLRPGRVERWRAYDLWPLLVHARLYGGAYVDEIARRLDGLPGS